MRKYLARQQVFLECHDLRLWVVLQKGIHESTATGRGFQHTKRGDAVFFEHITDGLRYLGRRIERCKHGGFQAIHVSLVCPFIGTVLADQPVQFSRRREEIEVGFRPLHGIRQTAGGIENALQSAETAITLQRLSLFCGEHAMFPVQGKGGAYRLDVARESCFPVKCHDVRDKVRPFP